VLHPIDDDSLREISMKATTSRASPVMRSTRPVASAPRIDDDALIQDPVEKVDEARASRDAFN
jgi:hypothetical protein